MSPEIVWARETFAPTAVKWFPCWCCQCCPLHHPWSAPAAPLEVQPLTPLQHLLQHIHNAIIPGRILTSHSPSAHSKFWMHIFISHSQCTQNQFWMHIHLPILYVTASLGHLILRTPSQSFHTHRHTDSEWERQRHTQTEKEIQRRTKTETDTERARDRERERDRERQRQRDRDRERQRDRQTDRQTESQRER